MADPIAVRRINHAVLWVTELERSIQFDQKMLGLTVIAREPTANAAFLRAKDSTNHHDLGLFGGAIAPSRRMTGLYHLAWQVDTLDEVEAARRLLIAAGAFAGASDHGATKSVYAHDPDQNEFEIMWMVPRESWGAFENSAPVKPLNLKKELGLWSGVSTARMTGS